MKKPDNQSPKKEDPLKQNSNTEKLEKSAAEIEARVIKFGQKYIDRLIELTEERMSGIREEDAKTSSVDTFVLFGNPDLDFITNFAETWKKKASKGKNPRIVLAGGVGRGTPPLIERVIEKYTDISDEEKNFLLTPERTEAEIMRFVLNKEGIDSDSYEDVEIEIEKDSKNTLENLDNSLGKIRGNNVAIVTSPVLLLRMGATASKVWKGKGLDIKTLITHDIDLEKFSPARRIEQIGYIAGYPKSFKDDNPGLNIYSEFQGSQKENNPNVNTVELAPEDWKLLEDLKEVYGELLECYRDRLEYEDASGRLILKEPKETT